VDGADPKPVLSYEWSVSAGKIIGGQGTTEILVDTAGTGGQAVTATVKVGGLSTGCDQGASCTMAIDGLILTRKFDEYGNITLRDEKARLANFAVQLRNEPGSEGYIFAYDKRAGGAQARATRAKKLLVSYDIAAERIVAVNGGYRQSRWVELFIAPVGAIPPKPMPDVPTHKAKASKGAVKRH
jgi:hypothetical protein